MSTGTGIFLAGLIIGLVMLYGQTKDRWNWQAISFCLGVAITLGIVISYEAINDWNKFEYNWSLRGLVTGGLTYFAIFLIAGIPMAIASSFYEKLFDKNFQYDKEGNERFIYKTIIWMSLALFFIVMFFYGNFLREIIHKLIYG